MTNALKPFFERTGTRSMAELREFVNEANSTIYAVERASHKRHVARRWKRDKNVIYKNLRDFEYILEVGVEPGRRYNKEIFPVMVQSMDCCALHGDSKAATRAVDKILSDGSVCELGYVIGQLIEKGLFRCALCWNYSDLTRFDRGRYTRVQHQHSTRDSYGSDWFTSSTYGWQTPLCPKCIKALKIRSTWDEPDEESELNLIARNIKKVSKEIKDAR